jgi:hypothetical protein
MADEKSQNAFSDQLAKVNAEANGIFGKLGAEIDKQAKAGVAELDVLKITRAVGIELNEAELKELQIDRIIFPHPWLPWHFWFPWRPIWCWWWHRFYPWYRCCPWWWHRCHWHHFH